MMLIPIVLVSVLAFATSADPTVPSHGDHLLDLLMAIHSSSTFPRLPESEKIIAIELIAAAESDSVTHYVDRIGFDRLLEFLDHINVINQPEAHLLEKYLIQELGQEEVSTVGRRSLQDVLSAITNDAAFKTLSDDDQAMVLNLAKAAENSTLTVYVEQVGYSRVLAVIEHITAPAETHIFLQYLSSHIAAELHHTHQNGPILG
ncbi:uncharacterized protein [Argopecten irradians]|uniref:uncharacterized protein n=1 Tax=Argopecten irradians TaxID=31199 RepID=UPI003723CFD7